jgi:hypothetical protein
VELVQPLGTYAHFLGRTEPPVFQSLILWEWMDALWYHLQGPGPYTAVSHHYSITCAIDSWTGVRKRIRTVLYVSRAGVAVKEFMELE